MARINQKFVDSVSTDVNTEYSDDTLQGFLLRVSKSGVKSYLIRARVKGGASISHTIGKHGAPWTATSARKEAETVLALMKLGVDPRDEKKQRQEQKDAKAAEVQSHQLKAELTLAAAFEKWYVTDRSTKDSTKTLYRQVIGKHLSDWMNLPLIEITGDMVEDRYTRIADNGSAINDSPGRPSVASANNTFRALRMLFNWHIVRQEDWPSEKQFLTKNPVRVLHRRNLWRVVKARELFIPAKDLPAWFDAVESLDNSIYRDYFRFVLVTGLRLTEASKLTWADVDWASKTFTVRDTKNGVDHCMPMTNYVETLFKRRRKDSKDSEFVFPGEGSRGYFKDARWRINQVIDRSGVNFTCHALRRTFSNFAMDAMVSDGQRKMLLNHSNRADVTLTHYSTKDAERMREPLQIIEAYILKSASRV